MMNSINPGDLATWIALAVAVIIGARGGIQRSTIAAQKEQIEAYESRERQHQTQLKEFKDQRAAKDEQTDAALKRLGDRNTYLEELVLRRAEGAEIIDVMRAHDSEAATRHAASIKVLRDIRDAQKDRTAVEQKLLEAIAALTAKESQ